VTYDVYATRWDDPHAVEELLPARGLSFSMPLSDHGECNFSATVEPGRSLWRGAITAGLSGVLVCRDDVPVWAGWVKSERETGSRTFAFRALEWGSIFARFPAPVGTWTENDHDLFRRMVTSPQAVAGRNVQVQVGTSLGASTSDLTINSWDNLAAETAFRRIADAQGGPEWYFGIRGTRRDPERYLALADQHGNPTVADGAVLNYVEDTGDTSTTSAPRVALLGDLFPMGASSTGTIGRRGGNVLAKARTRDTERSTTRAVAVGDGIDKAQLTATARADRLVDEIGWPELTTWTQHSSVTQASTLQRHANADLAAASGIATGWALATFDRWVDSNGKARGGPDWTQIPRGSMMRAILDTDVYAGPRPLTFESRLLNTTVTVPDQGAAQVTWEIAETLEVS
jgi:hypothetical protein